MDEANPFKRKTTAKIQSANQGVDTDTQVTPAIEIIILRGFLVYQAAISDGLKTKKL